MKAAVLNGPESISIKDVKQPVINKNEVLIKVVWGGICGSDISLYTGKRKVEYPLIMGHEIGGIVKATGSRVNTIKNGDKVTIQPNYACMKCEDCLKGRLNICKNKKIVGINYDGAFSEYIKAPESFVWKIPAGITLKKAALIEPVSVCLGGINKLGHTLNKNILLTGLGPIGIITLKLLKLRGATICAADIVEKKLSMAKKIGADYVFKSSELNKAKEKITKGTGFDCVVDCSGASTAIKQNVDMVRSGGNILLLGIPEELTQINTNKIVREEIIIKGSMVYVNEYKNAINLIENNIINIDEFITSEFKLEKVNEAFAAAMNGSNIKVMINIGDK